MWVDEEGYALMATTPAN